MWRHRIIKPIPKGSLLDPRISMQYWGTSLLSTIYEIYSGILISRFINFMESNNIYVLRHIQAKEEFTFVCFIDVKKAFDKIERDLLVYKLLNIGIMAKYTIALKISIRRYKSKCKWVCY